MLRTALSAALALVAIGSTATAAVFAVDTTSDASLEDCDAAVADDCSLRGAMARADATPEPDTIAFALSVDDPGYVADTAHWRIAPATALPVISGGPLAIDGFTQPGAAPNANPPPLPIGHVLRIELRGPDPANVHCLMAVSSLTVRGLALNNCSQAIFLFETGTHVVEGNYIGTDITGRIAVPNRLGVVLGGDVRVGGALPAQGNVLAGNRQGALVQLRQVTRLRVLGNTIGLDATQTAAIGRQDYGVTFSGGFADAVIGGSTAAEANVISGNGFNAVSVFDAPQAAAGAPQLRVIGNIIGATSSGVPFGNGANPGSPTQTQPAVQIGRLGNCRVAVGGDAPGEGNLFAYNAAAAVAVGSCWSAPVLGNSFLGNGGMPIDLSVGSNVDGPTPNDAGDIDGTGTDPFAVAAGNRLQNTVRVLAMQADAEADELQLTVQVDSSPAAAAYPLRIDIHRDDDTGLHPVAVEAIALEQAQQAVDIVLPLSLAGPAPGLTVTDAEGNTSEMVRTGGLFADGFEATPPAVAP